MKVTLNWLRDYVDFEFSAEELAERLTMLGMEVESIQKLGGEFEGIVVCQVLAIEKHPNADKLTVCRVADGKGERQIVCGASNFKVGDKVPLILPGYSLPAKPGEKSLTIKVGKIRGVESHGMMCSPSELGISDDAAGLMILPDTAKVGQPFAEFLGRPQSDVLFDLEITPNRPDLNSVIGIAREISALTGNPLRIPEVKLDEDQAGPAAADLVSVRIEDPDLCPRYTARVVRGVKVGPSPDWLRSRLEAVGQRSISNVVDVTNYVMLECGQPLHAFDYHLIAKSPGGLPTIIVRRALAGERFVTLDEQERVLTDEMLLIADPEKAIALAGVMGGLNTGINDRTFDVLIESAYFKPTNIRRTSKRLGLRTDASYRFERGADLGNTDWASRRCAQLILQTAGGQLARGVVDAYPKRAEPVFITLRHRKINELLGLGLSPDEIESYLVRLGLKIVGRKPRPVGSPTTEPEPVTFLVPSFRVDLKREADLAEEVCRLHGVEKIPAAEPRGARGSNEYDAVHDVLAEARLILTGLGLNEAQGQTLISEQAARLVTEDFVPLENPLSADMNVLRPSLLPGLLDALRHNVSRKTEDVALFELGRVFVKAPPPGINQVKDAPRQPPILEHRRIAIALTGRRNPPFWTGENREASYDLFDLKGIIEEFLDRYGVRGVTYSTRAARTSLFLESATIHLGRNLLGELGRVLPPLAERYDIRQPVMLAELNLDELMRLRNTSKVFKPLPVFPSIRRDVAMIVAETVTHETVLATLKQAKPPFLESVELFDVFRGKHVPPGHKSMAYALMYRSQERTLTDEEVNAAHQQVVNHLKQALNAVVREG
ncbi:MAG: phenylalanine--tRNA ligase subunit beta [Verrucomicrobiae bacterium]|nr:phenylalanine--tRNA ligase subunit beta [Verrucomicrobiae bacterium]